VVAVCAVVLLLWFVALGYADPSGLAARYNAAHGFALELR
jgi:hypothetical protein